MKARIIKKFGWYYGQVYSEWRSILTDDEWVGWHSVTPSCYTYLGAKYELLKWKKENMPDEFEL